MLRNARVVLMFALLPCLIASRSAAQPIGFRSMGNFLTAQGFDQIRLQRRFGNHLYFSSFVNGKPAALLIDSATPTTLVHRSSAATFGLSPGPIAGRESSIFGTAEGTVNKATLRTLVLGKQLVSDVPVVLADQAPGIDPPEFLVIPKLKPNARRVKLTYYNQIASVDGLLGLDLLRKYGAVVDCGHQMLYINAASANSKASEKLAAVLADRGFARIPMQLTRDRKPEIAVGINGHPTRLIVDTGSSFTLFGSESGYAAGVSGAPSRLVYDLGKGHLVQLSNARVRELTLGNFSLENADVTMANLSKEVLRPSLPEEANAGLLGIENLSLNYAVIDFGSMTLYLRHPDRR